MGGCSAWAATAELKTVQGDELPQPANPLRRSRLTRRLDSEARPALNRLDIFQAVDSTNAYLLARPQPPPGRFDLALAEFQTAGRGRRGRVWSMPFGAGVMLSMGWTFERPPPALAALSLAIGVAARDALAALGVAAVGLKWPNDLVWDDGKLGGILVEAATDSSGACRAVVGVGINVQLDQRARAAIETGWGRGAVDVCEARGGQPPSRNVLAALLVNQIFKVLRDYCSEGFAAYRGHWAAADVLAGHWVIAADSAGKVTGRAAGVDPDGALLVETAAGRRRITSGEVRVRCPP